MPDKQSSKVEEQIRKALRKGARDLQQLIDELKGAGTEDAAARDAAWHLLDRGEICLDQHMRLILTDIQPTDA